MKSTKKFQWLLVFFGTVFISGCAQEKMPEVNAENCKNETYLTMEDKEKRQSFISECSRQGEFIPSPKRVW